MAGLDCNVSDGETLSCRGWS